MTMIAPTSQRVDISQTHKACPVPGCHKQIPMRWTFCKDRNCQSRRHLAQEATAEYWQRKEEAEQRKRERASGYILGWKRDQRRRLVRLRDIAIINNQRLRKEAYEQALHEDNVELRALIREQLLDDRKWRAGYGFSLDQPLSTDQKRTFHDIIDPVESYLVEWHDPVGESALLHLDDDEEADREDVAAWNEQHRLNPPRIHTPLVGYYADAPMALASDTTSRRSRRRASGTTIYNHGKARNFGKAKPADLLTNQSMETITVAARRAQPSRAVPAAPSSPGQADQ